ncbi:hypothetical protein WMY93_014526 [Mugilogobius chulae]|uniref:tRNA (uracil-O(2)-)-methyltransferase n=1 Tax=Mugilogobius chulae TaxID=88201 RepID=A0AAW0NV74_9GOBI
MYKLFDLTFPSECKSLPEGFWSAVDVWIKKPHVVNKRLCGVKETESGDVDRDALGALVNGLSDKALNILDSQHDKETHDNGTQWIYSIRTFIPKVNCYGPKQHKEAILKCKDFPQVTFFPFEEDEEGQVSFKETNIYQFKLTCQESDKWCLELLVLSPDEWFSDGVAYPKLPWLSSDLLPKLVTLSLLPVEKYSLMYQQLKDKYKSIVKVWPEVTDPEKFVYEDVAIATYLLVLWSEERREKDLTDPQSFVDLGCGNGLLVHILTNEGHHGKGIDVRRRKIWDMYGPKTVLEEKAITPGESFLFPDTDWLIGNHSDELTPWIPVIAARSSYSCRYFVLPCCFFDFYGKYQRRQCKKSQYKEYIDFICEVSQVSGFCTEEDCLRIPSTKRVCLVGKSRSYSQSSEREAEQQRARYIQSRRSAPGVTVHGSDIGSDEHHLHDNTSCETPGSQWGTGFQPRDKVETVRNCASLPRDLVDGVVLQVARELLGKRAGDDVSLKGDWNKGGSLSVSEVAGLLEQDTLQRLKKECGGLQTLLKNNHQVFRVEGGRVHIRDWRDMKPSRDLKRKPIAPGALKTRLCWFHSHHPQGCPLQLEQCGFAHGSDDLRPSTKPLKKLKSTEQC